MPKERKHYQQISESFFKQSCDASGLPDICFEKCSSTFSMDKNLKLKGGSRLKIFDTEEADLSGLLSILRSLQIFNTFKNHSKYKIKGNATMDSLCTLCLVRSLAMKSRITQGRQLIKPVEILCALSTDAKSQTTVTSLNSIFEKMNICLPTFQNLVATKWNCCDCHKEETMTTDYCIVLDECDNSKCIEDLLALKISKLVSNHCCGVCNSR